MYERDLTSKLISLIKWVIIIAIVIFVGSKIVNYFFPKVTDMAPYVTSDKSHIEEQLGVSLPSNPDMLSKIYEYTTGEVTVCGSDGLGIVYIDGLQTGLHTNNRKYSLYGIQIGYSTYRATDSMTYQYDNSFVVFGDLEGDTAIATFYTNRTNNDCLVVVHNNIVNQVIAITYYSDMEKVTEELSPL